MGSPDTGKLETVQSVTITTNDPGDLELVGVLDGETVSVGERVLEIAKEVPNEVKLAEGEAVGVEVAAREPDGFKEAS